jgi:hypothetical protein
MQNAYIKASNSELFDNFGSATAISGDELLIGASREESSATGVNGNQADNSLGGAGAAYAFRVSDVIPPIVTPPSPTVDIDGRRRVKTEKAVVTVRGTATNATSVQFKTKKGRFRKARGVARWKAKVRLVADPTIVRVRASGPGGISRTMIVVYDRVD